MIYELNHVGMFVRDAEKTINFYKEKLGAKVVFDHSIPGRVHMAYLQIANGMIELICLENRESDFGYEHICFMTDNIDEDFQRLVQAGYTPIEAPRNAASGNGRLGFLADPSGVKVELIERDSTFRIPTITEGDIREFDHLSIIATDLEASEQFYTQHISMNPLSRKYAEAYNVTFSHLHKGMENLELMNIGESKAEGDRILHIALRVDDVNAMTEKLKSQGVELDPGYPKAAAFGGGLTAKFSGPDGEKIELVDRKPLQEI